jgi:two-component system, OmpR family, phosphate regulon sensor histidine kinase PhoR
MFDPKNLSPRLLSFYTALALAVSVSLIVYLVEQQWQIFLFIFFLILGSGYWFISFVLEKFIYRKIKLIYKFIFQTKATKREETYYKYILPKKSIDEVAEDVEAWAEENKKQVEALQANEQFRRDFLQNLSHEFKTPVFAIQGYVETLLDDTLTNPEIRKTFLEKTSSNVERLTNLLKDLDEISKLERGELSLIQSNFIIQDLIKDSYESISIKGDNKNIQFSIKKGCESPITVNADKEKIGQVILNVLENSIKYGKLNGVIKAGIYTTDNKRILIEISDNGIGIDEKSLPRIFERFYRTATGRSLGVTGSGLGLAICKHIIEAHGQTIHIRSRENIGTTVGFTLDGKKE